MDPREKEQKTAKNPAENPIGDKENVIAARHEAMDDIEEDPDFQSEPADDLDEGETARLADGNEPI